MFFCRLKGDKNNFHRPLNDLSNVYHFSNKASFNFLVILR